MKALRTRVVTVDPSPRGTLLEVEVEGAGWLPVCEEQKPTLISAGYVYLDDELLGGDPLIFRGTGGRPMKLFGFVQSLGLAERWSRFVSGQRDVDLVPGAPPVDLFYDPDAGEEP